MLRSLPARAKALPLCCSLLFIAAAEDDCRIFIVTEDGQGNGCEETDSVCNLDCELAVNDDGCEICECAQPPPSQGCAGDSDCHGGQICELIAACVPCTDDAENACVRGAACTFEGRCVDVRPDPCAAVLCSPDTVCAVDDNGEAVCVPTNERLCGRDEDCGQGRFCDFSQCDGSSDGSNRPAPPQDDGDSDVPFCAGVCSEERPPPPPPPSECSSDDECGPGAHCEITCAADSGCPDCDACLVVGQCVHDTEDCAALCGPGSQCVISGDGSVSCEPIGRPECTSDADCASGTCNAGEVCQPDPACDDESGGSDLVACTEVCWGYCVEPQPPSCFDDSECGDGEVCVVNQWCPACNDSDPACDAPCFIEGHCAPAP